MTWTKKPTESGWYWFCIVDGKWHSVPEICYVNVQEGKAPVCSFTSLPHDPLPKMYDCSLFYGPLPEPAFTHGMPLFEA